MMQRITNQSHSRDNLFIIISKTFERASYFGLRAIIVLYMISEVIKMERVDALQAYAMFTSIFYLSEVVGAFIGDLFFGNKKTIFIGGGLFILGALLLGVSSPVTLYVGLIFASIGGAVVTINLTALLGRSYKNNTKLLDAGFSFLYLGVNIGAFIGILVVGFLGEKMGWHVGFMVAGLFMLFSLLFSAFVKPSFEEIVTKRKLGFNKNAVMILIAVLASLGFWISRDLSYPVFNMITERFVVNSDNGFLMHFSSSLDGYILIPISILLIIIWTKFYYSRLFKIVMGFVFAGLAFGLLWIIQDAPIEHHLALYLGSVILFGFAEMHIGPVVIAIITDKANLKYLTILLSLVFLPQKMLVGIYSILSDWIYESPLNMILLGGVIITVSGIVVFIYSQISKEDQAFRSTNILDDIKEE